MIKGHPHPTVLLVLSLIVGGGVDANFFKESSASGGGVGGGGAGPAEDTCFCQLKGAIDDCSCQIGDVDKFNNFKIYPRLRSLLGQDYFRYYKINLRKPCPFWSEDGSCGLESCQVKTCKEEEIPVGLKGQKRQISRIRVSRRNTFLRRCLSAVTASFQEEKSCSEDLGSINETISQESQADFRRWKHHDERLVDFCTVEEDDVEDEGQYVDLLLNPERYTGYGPPSSSRIWSSIYNENCFQQSFSSDVMEPFKSNSNKSNDSCIEKRAFYRAISGLHASINIHVSAKYLLSSSKVDTVLGTTIDAQWGHNLSEFKKKFDKLEAQKKGFSWLNNLYFLYLLELKAVKKAAPFLRQFNFYTGNKEEDVDVGAAISDLLKTIELFPSEHFDESALFRFKDGLKLKAEFHQRFTNITRIMDCVGCQKCRLWGTIQIKGLGTALKILFTDPTAFRRGPEFLSRTEIVSLLNAFGRLSTSIFELENFRKLMENDGTTTSLPG